MREPVNRKFTDALSSESILVLLLVMVKYLANRKLPYKNGYGTLKIVANYSLIKFNS